MSYSPSCRSGRTSPWLPDLTSLSVALDDTVIWALKMVLLSKIGHPSFLPTPCYRIQQYLEVGASDHLLISFISCNALFPKQSRLPLLSVWNSVLFLYLLQVTLLFWRNNPPSLFSWWDSGSANSTSSPKRSTYKHAWLVGTSPALGQWLFNNRYVTWKESTRPVLGVLWNS